MVHSKLTVGYTHHTVLQAQLYDAHEQGCCCNSFPRASSQKIFTELPRVVGPCIETQTAPLTVFKILWYQYLVYLLFLNSDFGQISSERADPHAQELTATSHFIPTNAKGSASCSASLRLTGVSPRDI
jgi:hypothetical protein